MGEHIESPICDLHGSVMTFGRYSSSSVYSRAHTTLHGKSFYCNECVDIINKLVTGASGSRTEALEDEGHEIIEDETHLYILVIHDAHHGQTTVRNLGVLENDVLAIEKSKEVLKGKSELAFDWAHTIYMVESEHLVDIDSGACIVGEHEDVIHPGMFEQTIK